MQQVLSSYELTKTLDEKYKPFTCGPGSDRGSWTEDFIIIYRLSSAIYEDKDVAFVYLSIIILLGYTVQLTPPSIDSAALLSIKLGSNVDIIIVNVPIVAIVLVLADTILLSTLIFYRSVLLSIKLSSN